MKTDTIFYQLFKEFPSIFFALIDQPAELANNYQFTSSEVKQRAFRFDGLFLPSNQAEELPIYFVEVQFQKKSNFYARLFAEIFLYFYQYDHDRDWYAIVIYRRRSIETSAPRQYRELMHRVRRIYLDEIDEAAKENIGVAIIQLVVESKNKTGETARQLINKAHRQLPDATIRQQIIELIETIVVYKFPSLTRKEIEAMLGLSELKKTKVYQEAREEGRQEGQQEGLQEGRQEGLQEGQLRTKLAMIPKLQQRGLSIEEMADLLELDAETIRQRIQ